MLFCVVLLLHYIWANQVLKDYLLQSQTIQTKRKDCDNKRRLVEPPFIAKNNMIKVLLFHDSSLQCAVFSVDAVEVYASVEAAAINDKLVGVVAIHALADDLFAKNIEYAD